ncbi:hypothetical protein DFH11DRAFT_1728870 [Phellopilus nigrolimitatus]|nr:hypothetical protein DFH11DRAFT_1728870 [Phellopilus nigrolimitatus]
MAYFYNPSSYANTLFGSPFSRRRPSPPPTTYYPSSATYDPYVRALVEEQEARSALQSAIQREQAARRRRTEVEARAKARAQEEARARAKASRQRPQSFYGFPTGFAYPGDDYGYSEDEEEGDDDTYSLLDRYLPAPKHAPSQSCQRPESVRQRKSPHPIFEQAESAPKVTIPITSPTSSPTFSARPLQHSKEAQNNAASKIQSTYRVHAARKSALAEINSIKARFDALRSSFIFPSALKFEHDPTSYSLGSEEKPKLAYTPCNVPVHAHEDALLKLLQALDAVESHGNAHVRDARRALVKAVEAELGMVDAKVRCAWEERVAEANANTDSGELAVDAMEVEPTMTAELSTEKAKSDVELEFSPSLSALPPANLADASEFANSADHPKEGVDADTDVQHNIEDTVVEEPVVEESVIDEPVVETAGATSDTLSKVEADLPTPPSASLPSYPAGAASSGEHTASPEDKDHVDPGPVMVAEPAIEEAVSDMEPEIVAPPSASVTAHDEPAAVVAPPSTSVPVHDEPVVVEELVASPEEEEGEEEMVLVDETSEGPMPHVKATEAEFVMV